MKFLDALVQIGNSKKRETERGDASLSQLTDPNTGEFLPQRRQPGYYPGFRTMAQRQYWDQATRELIEKRISHVPPIRFFNADEARTMRAVVERVLPQDDRIAEMRIDVFVGIDERLYSGRIEGYRYADMPSDQDAYRIAVAAFEQMAWEKFGQSFHLLGTLQQEELLKSVHDGKPAGAHELWKRMNVDRFWTLLVSDCCSVYYAHPSAWDEIGFGGPAYPRGYMRLEEGEPEPWEVDEARYEWNAPANTLSDREELHGSGAEHQSHPGQGGTH